MRIQGVFTDHSRTVTEACKKIHRKPKIRETNLHVRASLNPFGYFLYLFFELLIAVN